MISHANAGVTEKGRKRMNNCVWSNENPEPPHNYDEHDQQCKCFNCCILRDEYCECGNELEMGGDKYCLECQKREEENGREI